MTPTIPSPIKGESASGRAVRLPFDFGEIVYHRAVTEKSPGMVTGFIVRERTVQSLVTWGDDLREGSHSFFELTTEFEPDIK